MRRGGATGGVEENPTKGMGAGGATGEGSIRKISVDESRKKTGRQSSKAPGRLVSGTCLYYSCRQTAAAGSNVIFFVFFSLFCALTLLDFSYCNFLFFCQGSFHSFGSHETSLVAWVDDEPFALFVACGVMHPLPGMGHGLTKAKQKRQTRVARYQTDC